MTESLLTSSHSAWLSEQAYNIILGNRFSSAVDQFKPRIFPDGDKWCCLYGDDIMSGVAGFGDTPAQAVSEWDNNFYNQRLNSTTT